MLESDKEVLYPPSAYKMFLNPLLDLHSGNRIGLQIGNVYQGVPACADDLPFLARSSVELQEMLYIQELYTDDENYYISDTETKVFIANSSISTETWNDIKVFNLNGNSVEAVEECTHLGIQRDCLSKTGHSRTIDKRLQSARSCAYSLMGAGLHGQNGVSPRVSLVSCMD